MSTYPNRRGHGYRSAAEIRKNRTITLVFALIATAALLLQTKLLFGYFSSRAEKNQAASDYQASERLLSDAENSLTEAQNKLNSLTEEIESLEKEYSVLSGNS